MSDGYFLQLARDCLGLALMDKYIPSWRNMTEEQLHKAIDEIKCNNTKQY